MNNDKKELTLDELEQTSGGNILESIADGASSVAKAAGNAVCKASRAAYRWFSGIFFGH